MTEREYDGERGDAKPVQREVHRERSVDEPVDGPTDVRREVSHERVAGPEGTYETRREHVVVPSTADRQAATARRIQQVIAFVIGTIVVLLGIRFVLLLLGANQVSPFVQLIYGLTQPLTAPFQGMFGEPTLGASVIEWTSLVAIICYSLLGYGLHRLVDMIYKPVRVGAADEDSATSSRL
ncbi:MAG: YggT family protein [Chloroflexales bacterium]|nr:YggT family protein [Chloroflexales bacterium]